MGPLSSVPCPTAFMTCLILSLHISTISPLVPNFSCNTYMILLMCFCDVTSINFALIPLSVSFVFPPTNFWASLCPNTMSLLTHSMFKPSMSSLLLVPFASYKASKEKLTFFIGLFLTMPPQLTGSFNSFYLPFHFFRMTKINSLFMPSIMLSLLHP